MNHRAFALLLSPFCMIACGDGTEEADPFFDREGYFVDIRYQQDDALNMVEPTSVALFSQTSIELILSAFEDRSMKTLDDNPNWHELKISLNRNDLESFELPIRLTIDGTSIFTSSGASIYRTGPDASPTIFQALYGKTCFCDFSPRSGQQKLNGFIEITEYDLPRMTGIIDVQIEGELSGDRDWGVNQLQFRARFETDTENSSRS